MEQVVRFVETHGAPVVFLYVFVCSSDFRSPPLRRS
jgi:hypothetical protein